MPAGPYARSLPCANRLRTSIDRIAPGRPSGQHGFDRPGRVADLSVVVRAQRVDQRELQFPLHPARGTPDPEQARNARRCQTQPELSPPAAQVLWPAQRPCQRDLEGGRLQRQLRDRPAVEEDQWREGAAAGERSVHAEGGQRLEAPRPAAATHRFAWAPSHPNEPSRPPAGPALPDAGTGRVRVPTNREKATADSGLPARGPDGLPGRGFSFDLRQLQRRHADHSAGGGAHLGRPWLQPPLRRRAYPGRCALVRLDGPEAACHPGMDVGDLRVCFRARTGDRVPHPIRGRRCSRPHAGRRRRRAPAEWLLHLSKRATSTC